MIHVLDIIIYLIGLAIIWIVLPKDFKEELGAVAGFLISIVYTIVYCIIFWFYNWSDIFASVSSTTINFSW